MAERRALTEGLRPAGGLDPRTEASFVFGSQPQPKGQETAPKLSVAGGRRGVQDDASAREERPQEPAGKPKASLVPKTLLVPLTTRLRAPLVAGLKRASLERQLAGLEPWTQQEILEQALEPWLRKNGYLE
jgi:hypothetical protein